MEETCAARGGFCGKRKTISSSRFVVLFGLNLSRPGLCVPVIGGFESGVAGKSRHWYQEVAGSDAGGLPAEALAKRGYGDRACVRIGSISSHTIQSATSSATCRAAPSVMRSIIGGVTSWTMLLRSTC